MALFVLGVVMLALIFFRFPETLQEERRSKGGLSQTITTFKRLANDRLFIGYALVIGLSSGVMFAYIAGSPFVLQEIFQVFPQMYSIIFAVNAMGLIIASQITGRLAGRIEESRFLAIGLSILLAGGVLLLSFTLMDAGLVPVLIALFLVVSNVGFISSSGMALAMNSQTKNAGSASALLGLKPAVSRLFLCNKRSIHDGFITV
jgi:DHA1 family bicyclomycin/chloramphenicol resistance-like MFS transporter